MSLVALVALALPIGTPATPRLITFFPNLGDGVQVRMNFRLTPTDNAPWPEATLSCTNACQGKVHQSHNDCDSSCDVTCGQATGRATHFRNLAPHFNLVFSESFGNFEAGVWRLSRNADVNPMRDMLQQHLNRMLRMSYPNGEGGRAVQLVHWNNAHCSEWLKVFSYRTYSIEAECDSMRMVQVNGRFQTTEGPKVKLNIGTLVMPELEAPPLDVITPACLCSLPATLERDEFGFIPGGGAFGTRADSYAISWSPPGTWGNVNLEFGCPDMTGFNVTLLNGTTVPIRGGVGPGIILRPEDARVQNMGIAEWTRFTAPAGWTPIEADEEPLSPEGRGIGEGGFAHHPGRFRTSKTADTLAPTTAKGYALCLDMDKREPKATDKFKFGICGDETLTRLLVFCAKERMKSPRDQARFWIYRNAATPEEIRTRMLPGPRDDEYVHALFEVATVGMADLSDAKYRRCFSPSLLAKTGNNRATEWFMKTSATWNAAAIVDWLSGAAPAFERLLGDNATSNDRVHAATIFRAIGFAPNPELREAGLRLLSKLEGPYRAKLVQSKGLAGYASWLTDNDVPGAAHAIEAIKLGGPSAFKPYLLSIHEALPAAVKEEAAALLKGLEPAGGANARR